MRARLRASCSRSRDGVACVVSFTATELSIVAGTSNSEYGDRSAYSPPRGCRCSISKARNTHVDQSRREHLLPRIGTKLSGYNARTQSRNTMRNTIERGTTVIARLEFSYNL